MKNKQLTVSSSAYDLITGDFYQKKNSNISLTKIKRKNRDS